MDSQFTHRRAIVSELLQHICADMSELLFVSFPAAAAAAKRTKHTFRKRRTMKTGQHLIRDHPFSYYHSPHFIAFRDIGGKKTRNTFRKIVASFIFCWALPWTRAMATFLVNVQCSTHQCIYLRLHRPTGSERQNKRNDETVRPHPIVQLFSLSNEIERNLDGQLSGRR